MENPKEKVRKNGSNNSHASNDGNTKGVNLDPIPLDLTFEILTRLPAESLVKFQCVSKLWSSHIRSLDFINSFHTRSLTRSLNQPPLLGSICKKGGSAYLFLSPQPKSSGEKSSYAPKPGLIIPTWWYQLISLRGLICFRSWFKPDFQIAICNPSTRQLISIPECKPESIAGDYLANTYFGYNAVNDQYKVLCTFAGFHHSKLITEHHIFVLGTGDSWRSIQATVPHCPALKSREVYINGVLYYGASNENYNINDLSKVDRYSLICLSMIVRFDVRTEEFNFIKLPAASIDFWKLNYTILMKYEGKVALVNYSSLKKFGFVEFWVLEDEEIGEWSKMSQVMPPCWKDIDANEELLFFHGTIHTGEIVLVSSYLSDPLNVFYYDLKRNNIRRVQIKGFPDLNRLAKSRIVSNYLDHIESIVFLEDYSLPGISPITLHQFQ